jgi:hypothetical protein
MLKRIQISVFQPSKIAFFLKDKMGYVFLYMALLALLATLPMAIQLHVVSPLNAEVKQDITGAFIQKATPCEIVEGTLACINPESMTIGGIEILFMTTPEPFKVQFIFEANQISLYSAGVVMDSITYTELGFDNINLALQSQQDVDTFKNGLVRFVDKFQSLYASTLTIYIFIANFILYMLLSGIMAFSYGFRMEKLTYRYRFIMAVYSTTSYFILALVAELYGLGFLMFLGMFLPFITMTIAFNGLLRMSKVVVPKKDDEA